MSMWKHGMEKLGFIMYPERHIRGAMYITDSAGKKYMRFLITNKNEIGRLESIFRKHGVPVAQHKTGMDGFPVLQIPAENIDTLPHDALDWLMKLYKGAIERNRAMLQNTIDSQR